MCKICIKVFLSIKFKIKASPKQYLESDSHLTVHIEWYDSIMLFNHIYHKYDDIARTHCHQMRYGNDISLII